MSNLWFAATLPFVVVLLAIVGCFLWDDGPNNYPAGRIAMATTGVNSVVSICAILYTGDYITARQLLFAVNAGAGVQLLIIGLQLWIIGIITTHKFAKPGSDISIFGQIFKPSKKTIEWALMIIARADKHDLLDAEQSVLSEVYLSRFRTAEEAGQERGERAAKRGVPNWFERQVARATAEIRLEKAMKARRKP